ncbi:MAG: ankyrin repeat domain-containing protein [Planctomycetes bacterium]|nr:ankyrin repeat domain-containing protein [Planctomycetota bacterium]
MPPQKPDTAGQLIRAVLDERLDDIRRLIAAGEDVNQTYESGETLLTWAASDNKLRGAKLLVELGADINQTMDDGMTALDVAVCSSSPEFRAWLKSIGGIRGWTFDEWPWPPPPEHKGYR